MEFIRSDSGIENRDFSKQAVEVAKTMVNQYVKHRRFVDLLPAHFVVGIMRRLIVHTTGNTISNK